jgi:hypothetical protein
MAFSRDDLTAYEAQPVKNVPNSLNQAFGKTPDASVSAPPAATTPAPATEASSAPEAETVPAESGDVSSAVDESVEAAPAPAESDGSSTSQATTESAAPTSKTIPYERFQEVVEERNALKKYSGMLFERFEALQKQPVETAAPASQTPAPTPVVEAELLPPTLASVNYDEAAYQKEMAKWGVKVAERTAVAVTSRVQAQQTAEQVRSAYLARETAFAEKNPNFKVVTQAPLPAFAPDVASTILTDANGPAVVYHLAQHPDEALRLSRMAPAQQLVRLGQIISQVTPAAAAKTTAKTQSATPRTVTKAPPPPKPTPGGTAPVTTGMPPSMAEFAAQERARKVTEREQRQKLRIAMR